MALTDREQEWLRNRGDVFCLGDSEAEDRPGLIKVVCVFDSEVERICNSVVQGILSPTKAAKQFKEAAAKVAAYYTPNQ